MSERGVFKRDIDEEGAGMHAHIGYDGDDFGEEEIVEKTWMGKIISAKVFVCCNEVVKKDVLAIPDKTWLTG